PDKFEPTKPQETAPTLVMAHQLRDALSERGAVNETLTNEHDRLCKPSDPDASLGGTGAGGPRAVAAPVDNVVTGAPVSPVKVPELPSLRKILCTGADTVAMDGSPLNIAISDLQFGASPKDRDESFPDLRSLTSDENWSLVWEGVLSLDT